MSARHGLIPEIDAEIALLRNRIRLYEDNLSWDKARKLREEVSDLWQLRRDLTARRIHDAWSDSL